MTWFAFPEVTPYKKSVTLATFLLLFGKKSAGLVTIAFGHPGLGARYALAFNTNPFGNRGFPIVAAAYATDLLCI